MATPIILNADNFENEVVNSDVPVLVDFWAAWCGPCKMIAPTVEELANDFEGKAKIAKLDIDENRDLAMRYKVQSIPTLLVLKNGEEVDRIIGAVPKPMIAEKINSAL